MEDLLSLVEENIVILLPALERGQREFCEMFLIGEGGVEEYGCVVLVLGKQEKVEGGSPQCKSPMYLTHWRTRAWRIKKELEFTSILRQRKIFT